MTLLLGLALGALGFVVFATTLIVFGGLAFRFVVFPFLSWCFKA